MEKGLIMEIVYFFILKILYIFILVGIDLQTFYSLTMPIVQSAYNIQETHRRSVRVVLKISFFFPFCSQIKCMFGLEFTAGLLEQQTG